MTCNVKMSRSRATRITSNPPTYHGSHPINAAVPVDVFLAPCDSSLDAGTRNVQQPPLQGAVAVGGGVQQPPVRGGVAVRRYSAVAAPGTATPREMAALYGINPKWAKKGASRLRHVYVICMHCCTKYSSPPVVASGGCTASIQTLSSTPRPAPPVTPPRLRGRARERPSLVAGRRNVSEGGGPLLKRDRRTRSPRLPRPRSRHPRPDYTAARAKGDGSFRGCCTPP